MVTPSPSGITGLENVQPSQLAKRMCHQRFQSNRLRNIGFVVIRLDIKAIVLVALGFAAAIWLRGGTAHAFVLIALGAGFVGLSKAEKDDRYDP